MESNVSQTAIESRRTEAMQWLRIGQPVPSVEIVARSLSRSELEFGETLDHDGDNIVASGQIRFLPPVYPHLQIYFFKGCDRRFVARALRKAADMVVGDSGDTIVNLVNHDDVTVNVQRNEDGSVHVRNVRTLLEEINELHVAVGTP